MSNAQYSIRDLVSKKYNRKEDYISENNFIHWINKENETLISDSFLINNEKILSLINDNINNNIVSIVATFILVLFILISL